MLKIDKKNCTFLCTKSKVYMKKYQYEQLVFKKKESVLENYKKKIKISYSAKNPGRVSAQNEILNNQFYNNI